jgi:hypothetical protein
MQVGVNALSGQTVILQTSTNLVGWEAVATNTLSSLRWTYTNSTTADAPARFYRAALAQ